MLRQGRTATPAYTYPSLWTTKSMIAPHFATALTILEQLWFQLNGIPLRNIGTRKPGDMANIGRRERMSYR